MPVFEPRLKQLSIFQIFLEILEYLFDSVLGIPAQSEFLRVIFSTCFLRWEGRACMTVYFWKYSCFECFCCIWKLTIFQSAVGIFTPPYHHSWRWVDLSVVIHGAEFYIIVFPLIPHRWIPVPSCRRVTTVILVCTTFSVRQSNRSCIMHPCSFPSLCPCQFERKCGSTC